MAADRPIPRRRQGGRRVTARARRQGANLAPETGIPYQTSSRLPDANQVFLGSWMADVRQEGRSQRSALQRRHIAHLRQRSCCTPRKPSSWDPGGGKTHRPTWEECTHQTPSSSSPELLGPGKGTKRRPNQVCACVEYPRT